MIQFYKDEANNNINTVLNNFIEKSDENAILMNKLLEGLSLQAISELKEISYSKQSISLYLVALYKEIFEADSSIDEILVLIENDINHIQGFSNLDDYFNSHWMELAKKIVKYFKKQISFDKQILFKKEFNPKEVRVLINKTLHSMGGAPVDLDAFIFESSRFIPQKIQFSKSLFLRYINTTFFRDFYNIISYNDVIISSRITFDKLISYLFLTHRGNSQSVYLIIQEDFPYYLDKNKINTYSAFNAYIVLNSPRIDNVVLIASGLYETHYEAYKDITDEDKKNIIKYSLEICSILDCATDTNYLMDNLSKLSPRIANKINPYILKSILVDSGLFQKGKKLSLIPYGKQCDFPLLKDLIEDLLTISGKKELLSLSLNQIYILILSRGRKINKINLLALLNREFIKNRDGKFLTR